MPLSYLKDVTKDLTNRVSHQVNQQARNLTERLPDQLQRPARAIQGLLNGDTFQEAQRLLTHFRYRKEYDRLQSALNEFRYFTGILMARDLGIYEALDDRPMTAGTLAETCDIHPRSARSILRVLETDGLVVREGSLFKLSDFGSEYLAPGGLVSIDPFLEFMSAFAGSYDDIVEGMKTGEIPPKLDVFSDEANYEAYLEAVNFYLNLAGRDFLTRVDLPDIRHFIVGSMGVSFSGLLLNEYPASKVTYGCLDHLVDHIPSLRMEYNIDPDRVTGMHRHSGDPSDDDWGGESYDLVFLTKKMLLEPDEKMGEKFARKAYDVLNEDGVTLFWETVHPDDEPTPYLRAVNEVTDRAASPDGFSLTEDGFRETLRDIGYGEVEYVHCLDGEANFVVARK
jgi:hypothetical protein